jgi:hypothetical protein
MEQSSKNENTCDLLMNEVRMEDEPLQELKTNVGVQIEESRNLENNEKNMKEI